MSDRAVPPPHEHKDARPRMAIQRTSPTRFPMGLIDLSPESPFCPIDWRWRRAEWRVQTKSRCNERYDDEWTRRAARHHRKRQRTDSNITRRQKLDNELVLAEMISIRQDYFRAELDARILADQSVSEISHAIDVPEGVITAYEALFFDVRRRLGARSWIIHNVLRDRCWVPFQAHDVMCVWKIFGYFYGPLAVDYLVQGVALDELTRKGLPAYWEATSKLPKSLQFLLIMRSLPDCDLKTLKSLCHLQELDLCGMPRSSEAPPKSLALNLVEPLMIDTVVGCRSPEALLSALRSELAKSTKAA